MINYGFIIHFVGIFADGSMAVRVYVKKTQWYRSFALILVTIYTLLWLAWLIACLTVRYRHDGKVCSGSYLGDDLDTDVA